MAEGSSAQLDEDLVSSGKAVGRTTMIDNALALNAVDVGVKVAHLKQVKENRRLSHP